ncbi:hypothetical protein V8G54_031596 [Vigna mungo]|uniref:Uncharacterized protein n=1 Tax=Vigna mungo TaxID=3915 RepID=A0AAQ3REP2_VIGMU
MAWKMNLPIRSRLPSISVQNYVRQTKRICFRKKVTNTEPCFTTLSLFFSELCQSLKLTEQTTFELDGSTGSRKPPRKEKKKLAASCANQASAVEEQRRSGSMDNIDSDLSQSHRISQIRVIPFSNKVKGHSTCVDGASMMDGTGINPGNRDHPASIMHPPTKRHKLYAFFVHLILRHLYFQNLNEQLRTDLCPRTSHEEMVAFQDSSLRCPSSSQMDNVHEGRSPQKSDHILTKSSEVCILKAGGLPSSGLSNQFLLDNVSRSTATHVGLTRSNFLPTSYSFSSNTGNSLGTMQQPNGSVPVI